MWNERMVRRPSHIYHFDVARESELRLTKSLPRYLISTAFAARLDKPKLTDERGEEYLMQLGASALDAAVVPVGLLAAARKRIPVDAYNQLREISFQIVFPLAVFDYVVLLRVPLPSVFLFVQHAWSRAESIPLSLLISCVSLLWLKGMLASDDGLVRSLELDLFCTYRC